MKQYDVVIVGAGVVGSSLALSLAQQGLTVALVDQTKTLSTQANPAIGQVSAINQACRHWFEQLGIWSTIASYQPGFYQTMHVWEDNGCITFDSATSGINPLGHIIANNWILHALSESILQHRQIAYLPEQHPKLIHQLAYSRVLTLDSGQRLQASLLVGADGGNSWVRQQQQIPTITASYGQTAIAGQITTTDSHQNTAWQRFLPTGPLGLLPMHDEHECSFVWSCDKQYAAQLLSSSDQGFTQSLQEAMQHRLGEMALKSERKSFPLVMRHARHYVESRLALVGDAIHTIHPLAGLGLNLGLKDAQTLSQCVVKAHQKQQDIGNETTLKHYQQQRHSINLSTIMLMQGFKNLFSYEQRFIKTLRNWGLRQSDRSNWLKKLIISQANH